VARRQTDGRGSLDDEVALLVVHGVLHLLNYDHAEDQESEAMRKRERELLARFRELEQEEGR
jgi:probable rRNA maturation factor